VRRFYRVFVALALVACAAPLAAQYGRLVEAAANGDGPSVGDCILILGAAAGSLEPESGADAARASLSGLGYRLPEAPDADRISYAEFSYLIVQLFDLPYGFAYRVLPGPRTAFREAARLGLLPPGARPERAVVGPDVLYALRALEAQGRGKP